MKLFVDFWKFTKICKDLRHRNKELFLFWFLDVQNNFMFPTCKNSQKRVKNQKSVDKNSSSSSVWYLFSCTNLKKFDDFFVEMALGSAAKSSTSAWCWSDNSTLDGLLILMLLALFLTRLFFTGGNLTGLKEI